MQPSIVQFGTSRFLQAHVDLFVHEAREEGQPDGSIAVVAGSGSVSNRRRLEAFNDPAGYPVIIRGMEDGRPVDRRVQVKSIAQGLEAERDWAQLVNAFAGDIRFVVSNTTEAGLTVPEGFRLDLDAPLDAVPPTYPARLLALLAARFSAGRPGLTIFPTELVGRNGEVLRASVFALAARSGAGRELADWLENECVFASSLVDRIVSEPLEPAGAVAEPYALWAVEAKPGLVLPCTHPAIRVVDDLEAVERLKIHILNLGHTVMAERWMEEGSPAGMTVRVFLDRHDIAAALEEIYREEVVPGFAARGMGAEAAAYVATTLERFRNPFLKHALRDIATNHKAKIDKRIRAFLDWSGTRAPRLEALAARYAREAAA